ncbi:hypothetical protein LZ24_01716 [Desulfobotulus alkaliphilus]|uniref:Uncharacterized protein n=1 Tax=Desulfobotulus alkaliphilus TaxID=622671 RepID=A0A562RTD3_9BACT|nr:hypothetical protein [Desulfobotulus alkaliphilus]TWI72308.1 hypothetical protein LZ24_01716 [Desulfobotulus alkaliphilus]
MQTQSQTTLYTSGHQGTESEFGRLAESCGIKEIHYSWATRDIERSHAMEVLDAATLAKGDVSMEIVSKRMGRSYSKVDTIRKVMQLLFHTINHGHQVFAVGWIQEDGTVKGGTGWGVELAKFFNRPLSVYDQKAMEWFTWQQSQWVKDCPVIGHSTFAATGTRHLSEEGKAAIADLFARSFKK